MFATQLNGTPKYPKCLGEDHFLDKMLNSGSHSAIFPEHLYASLFCWEKNDASKRNLPMFLIIIHFVSLNTSATISRWQSV